MILFLHASCATAGNERPPKLRVHVHLKGCSSAIEDGGVGYLQPQEWGREGTRRGSLSILGLRREIGSVAGKLQWDTLDRGQPQLGGLSAFGHCSLEAKLTLDLLRSGLWLCAGEECRELPFLLPLFFFSLPSCFDFLCLCLTAVFAACLCMVLAAICWLFWTSFSPWFAADCGLVK